MFLVNDPNSTSKDKIKCYKKLISIKEQLIESGSWTYSSSAGGYVMDYCYPDNVIEDFKLKIQKYHYEIKRLDPNYEIPQYTDDNGNNRIGGCYIATAVYGSYDCPEVWVLRRFRDNMLAKKWYGRMFIKTYYATSPTLVKFLGDASWFKYICKRPLDKLVKKLKLKGVKNTPYKDK